MHEVLVNRLGGLSLPRKSVVRLTDRPDMTLDVYRGRKTTMQQQCNTSHGLIETKLKVFSGVGIHCTFKGKQLDCHGFGMSTQKKEKNFFSRVD